MYLCRKFNNKGIVLVTTLWILCILAVFAVALGHRAAVMLNVTRKLNSRLKSYFAAKAGINFGIDELLKDEKSTQVDHFDEDWTKNMSKDLGSGRFMVTIIDENRKININSLMNIRYLGVSGEPLPISVLISVLGCDREFAGDIVDYVDSDNTKILGLSPEEGNLYFTNKGLDSQHSLMLLEELMMIKAFNVKMLADIQASCCSDSTQNPIININTVAFNEDYSSSGLLSTLGLSAEIISAIGLVRSQGGYFSDFAPLNDYQDNLKPYLGVNSNLFFINSKGYSSNDNSYYEINVLFDRKGKKIVKWQQNFISGINNADSD